MLLAPLAGRIDLAEEKTRKRVAKPAHDSLAERQVMLYGAFSQNRAENGGRHFLRCQCPPTRKGQRRIIVTALLLEHRRLDRTRPNKCNRHTVRPQIARRSNTETAYGEFAGSV